MSASGPPLSFVLELFDKMSAPAGDMSKALDGIVKSLDSTIIESAKAQGNLDKLGEATKRQAQLQRAVVSSLNQRASAAFKKMVNEQVDKSLGKESPLVAINNDLGELKTKAGGLGVDWLHLGRAALGAGALAGAFSFGILPAAKAALGVVSSIWDGLKGAASAAYSFAKTLVTKAIGQEKSNLSMKFLLGDSDAAHVSRYINDAAKSSAFLRGELKGAAKDLIVSGFSVAELPEAMAAAQDVAVIAGTGLEDAVAKLSKIKLTGKISDEFLGSLKVSERALTGRLSAALGMSPPAVKKAITEGKVSANTVLNAIYAELAAKGGSGQLGAAAVKAGGTVESLLYKLSHLPETYMGALASSVGKSAAFDSFRAALQKLNDILDPSSAVGQKFIDKIGKLITWLTDFLVGDALKDGPEALSGLEAAMLKVGDAFDTVIPYIQIAVSAVKELFKLLTNEIPGAGAIGGLFSMLSPLAKIKADADKAVATGRAAGQGLAAGIQESVPVVQTASTQLASSSSQAMSSALEVASPSRVFARLGRQVAAGYAEGVSSGSGYADLAVADMAAAPRVSGGGGLGGTRVDVGGINIEISGAGKDAQAVAAEVSTRLRSELPSILSQMFEVMQAEAGTSAVSG